MKALKILVNGFVLFTVPIWILGVVIYDVFDKDSPSRKILSGKKWFWE